MYCLYLFMLYNDVVLLFFFKDEGGDIVCMFVCLFKSNLNFCILNVFMIIYVIYKLLSKF